MKIIFRNELLLVFVFFLSGITHTAWADTGNVADGVYYVDADGNVKNTATDGIEGNDTPIVLNGGGDTTLSADNWYVVNHDITYTGTITLSDHDVTIILCDGKTMNIGTASDPRNKNCINGAGDDRSLTIYGQSGQTGVMKAYGSAEGFSSVYVKNFTQYGGNVIVNSANGKTFVLDGGNLTLSRGTLAITASGTGYTALKFDQNNNATIAGGTLTVISEQGYAIEGTVIFNGGNFTANGYYAGILGKVYLGWSNLSDSFTCNSFDDVIIAEGKTFYDDMGNSYTASTPNLKESISGKTLHPWGPGDWAETANNEYTIGSPFGWEVFCDALQDNDTWNRFSGKTVKLGADITITRMAGSSGHEFCGTFDGNHKTMTVSISNSDGNAAPFREIMGATIRNLKVSGSVSGKRHSAGLVGFARGESASVENTIENCLVDVAVSITGDDHGYLGGIVGHGLKSKLTIRGCAFTGSLTSGSYYTGGLQGWSDGNTLILEDDIFAASSVSAANVGFHPIAFHVYNATTTATVRNVYYTVAPTCTTASRIAAAGKAAHTITAGENVTLAIAGNATEYTVSGITAYTTGIKYGGMLYAGSGDQLSLTLSITGAPAGFNSYTTNAGTLSGTENPYTLTMPDENVTIGARSVSYIDEDGVEKTKYALPLQGGEATTLTSGWYVVNEDVNYTGKITLGGDVNIILADGKKMTVTNTGTGDYDYAIYGEGKALHIYGQSQGTGALTATAVSNAIYIDQAAGRGGFLGIHGGVIKASSSNYTGIGVANSTADGSIVISGGQVTASGNNSGIYSDGGHIDIIGGQVTATGTENGGLSISDADNNPGVLTLGCSKPTDFISTNKIFNYKDASYEGEVKIAAGQTLVDNDGNIYNSATASDALAALTNVTLRPVMGVTLTKDDDNISAAFDGTSTTTVSIPVDIAVNSVTYNRTFTNGKASTVMLPFDYTCNGNEGGKFYTFGGVQKENNTWVATMNEVTGALTKNTPYLFMPAGTSLTFTGGATLNTTGGGNGETTNAGSHWTFKGTYEYMKWTDDPNDPDYNAEREAEIGRAYGFAGVEKTGIDLGDFVRVKSGAKIRPMCCYLLWNDIPNIPNFARSFTRGAAATDEELPQRITVRLVGSNGETTGIGTLDTKTGEIDFSGWYDMSGHKLSGKPTKKGLYINNGKKVVIK